MINASDHTGAGKEIAPSPHDDLHIYYLAGRLDSEAALQGPEFLGNWEEDGFSF